MQWQADPSCEDEEILNNNIIIKEYPSSPATKKNAFSSSSPSAPSESILNNKIRPNINGFSFTPPNNNKNNNNNNNTDDDNNYASTNGFSFTPNDDNDNNDNNNNNNNNSQKKNSKAWSFDPDSAFSFFSYDPKQSDLYTTTTTTTTYQNEEEKLNLETFGSFSFSNNTTTISTQEQQQQQQQQTSPVLVTATSSSSTDNVDCDDNKSYASTTITINGNNDSSSSSSSDDNKNNDIINNNIKDSATIIITATNNVSSTACDDDTNNNKNDHNNISTAVTVQEEDEEVGGIGYDTDSSDLSDGDGSASSDNDDINAGEEMMIDNRIENIDHLVDNLICKEIPLLINDYKEARKKLLQFFDNRAKSPCINSRENMQKRLYSLDLYDSNLSKISCSILNLKFVCLTCINEIEVIPYNNHQQQQLLSYKNNNNDNTDTDKISYFRILKASALKNICRVTVCILIYQILSKITTTTNDNIFSHCDQACLF